ncbi:polyprenyl diphosphate synthase [Acaricomes phytoseiuli]|uniref:polyprenyl diphosphate synthase n=1 Tax=Acaricomes phytoseiuli TaxID=291968 RepID=UPI000371D2F4|nr:polyprenyl diphosphate synthase [Acaricomes phytoseiuli]MCW1250007.1 polyprenyl diphosphate synthase [Acaricomes phytoseiuli]
MTMPRLLYGYYERRLAKELRGQPIPGHVAMVVDGNRRWAKQFNASTGHGHRAGLEKIIELLSWCQEFGIRTVTIYMLSTENINRSKEELDVLLGIIATLMDRLEADGSISVSAMGAPELLPDYLANRLVRLTQQASVEATGTGPEKLHINLAVGYGGRREIVDAVRGRLREAAAHGEDLQYLAERLDVEDISRYLYTSGQPDPDLFIRTSGEQRLSGFLLWQGAYSEMYFCEVLWPAFRKVDFLRALRDYAGRHRRFGN